jgi:hypothetical protein
MEPSVAADEACKDGPTRPGVSLIAIDEEYEAALTTPAIQEIC